MFQDSGQTDGHRQSVSRGGEREKNKIQFVGVQQPSEEDSSEETAAVQQSSFR